MKRAMIGTLAGLLSCVVVVAEAPAPRVISKGDAAGTYQAFPDVCRVKSGALLCVFYAGYGHVSLPKDGWPSGGRIGI